MIRSHKDVDSVRTAAEPGLAMADLGAPWRGRAACAGEWKLFDDIDEGLNPGHGGPMSKARRDKLEADLARAAAMCASCPVLDQCREAVIPAAIRGIDGSYSFIAGKFHQQYRGEYPEAMRIKEPQPKILCPKGCGRHITKSQLPRHLDRHARPIPHGTWTGYEYEIERGVPTCDACRAVARARSGAGRRRARIQKRAMMSAADQSGSESLSLLGA